MAARKAARYVTVGETTYAPGEEIPSDVVAMIDNPAAWDSEDEDGGESADSATSKAAAKRSSK